MFDNKDFSKMTLEELEAAEKKLKSPLNIVALIVGFCMGLAVWSATHKSGAMTYFLLFLSILIVAKSSRDLKKIQAEILRRNGQL